MKHRATTGPRLRRALLYGLALLYGFPLLYGFAPVGWIVYFIIVLGSSAGIAGSAMQSYITKHLPATEHGAVQGIYSGLVSLAGIPGPLIATRSFDWAVSAGQPTWLSGLTFFIAAALALTALTLPAPSFAKDHVPFGGRTTG